MFAYRVYRLAPSKVPLLSTLRGRGNAGQNASHDDCRPFASGLHLDGVHEPLHQGEAPSPIGVTRPAPAARIGDGDGHGALAQLACDLEDRLAEAVAVLDRVRARLVRRELHGV